jgi:hypothetical protein
MALRMITSFNASEIFSSGVTSNKYGGKAIYLNGQNKSRLMFQLPPLKAIVGVKESDKAPGTFTMPLSLDNEAVQNVFKSIDNYALELIAANSQDFLGKKMTREVIEAGDSWKPLVKPSKKDGYPPLLNLKPWYESKGGPLKTEAYTADRQPTDLFSLDKGQRVSVIVEISQIWKSPLGFGVSIRLHKVMFAPTTKLTGCAFLPEADAPVVESDNADEEGEEVEEYEEDE